MNKDEIKAIVAEVIEGYELSHDVELEIPEEAIAAEIAKALQPILSRLDAIEARLSGAAPAEKRGALRVKVRTEGAKPATDGENA